MTDPVQHIREALGPEAATGGEAALDAHTLDGLRPAAVAFPESAEQVAALLALAAKERWGVVPWGSGSGMGRGRPPARYDVAVSLRRLAAVHDHDVENLTLTADAGLSLAEANRQVGERHQMLPIGHMEAPNTLGGIVAANRLAPRRLLYGEVRDQLLGLRVALADGTLVRYGRKVLKNVAGYDMNKLFLGSQGMLGVIVETTFKLCALPDEEGALLARFSRLEDAAAAAGTLFRSQLLPACLYLLDAGAAARLPARSGADAEGVWLLVSFEGRTVALQRQLQDGEALLRQHGATDTARMPGLTPDVRDALEAPAGHDAPAAVRVRLGSVPTAVPLLISRAQEVARTLGVPGTVVADYAAGQALLDLASGADDSAAAHTLSELRALMETDRGWLALEAAPPALKAALDPLGASAGETRLMARLKARFDPGEVMVPGRFL